MIGPHDHADRAAAEEIARLAAQNAEHTARTDADRATDTLRRDVADILGDVAARAPGRLPILAERYGDADAVARETVIMLATAHLRTLGIGAANAGRLVRAAMRRPRSTAAPSTGAGVAPTRPAQGRAEAQEEVEPWPEPVDGAVMLAELVAFVGRYLVLPPSAAEVLALWAVLAWCIDAFEVAPRLVITSATRRCGKSRVLRLLRALVLRPLASPSMSPAALYRLIDARAPTVLLDEADNVFDPRSERGDLLRCLVNDGFERGGEVYRCVEPTFKPVPFKLFALVAIGAIGRVPETIEDRAIILMMRRKAPAEKRARLRTARIDGECADLRRRMHRWAMDHVERLRGVEPVIPAQLDDRASDLWEPMLAIADAAGGEWPARARTAALALAGERDAADDSVGVLLLRDIEALFVADGGDRLASHRIVTALGGMEGSQWSEWGKQRKPITQVQLAGLLRPFRIAPRTIKLLDGSTPKGYHRSGFDVAFASYLGPRPATMPPRRENTGETDFSDPQPSDPGCASESPANPHGSRPVAGLRFDGGNPGGGESETASAAPSAGTVDDNVWLFEQPPAVQQSVLDSAREIEARDHLAEDDAYRLAVEQVRAAGKDP